MATASKKVTCAICNKDIVKLKRNLLQMHPSIEEAKQEELIHEEKLRGSTNLEKYFHCAFIEEIISCAMHQLLKKGKLV